jgi:hypothetical protein
MMRGNGIQALPSSHHAGIGFAFTHHAGIRNYAVKIVLSLLG